MVYFSMSVTKETGQIIDLPVTAGTVIIDSSLELKRNEHRRRFTMVHEGGGHWLLHKKAFSENNPCGPAGIYENQFLAAKEGREITLRDTKWRLGTDLLDAVLHLFAPLM